MRLNETVFKATSWASLVIGCVGCLFFGLRFLGLIPVPLLVLFALKMISLVIDWEREYQLDATRIRRRERFYSNQAGRQSSQE